MNDSNTNAAKANQIDPCMNPGTTTQTGTSKIGSSSHSRTLRALPLINRTSTQKLAKWENTFLSVTCGIGVGILCFIVMWACFLKKTPKCQPIFFRKTLPNGQHDHAAKNAIINQ